MAGDASVPKFQLQIVLAVPVLVFSKFTGKPVHCGAVEINPTTGVGVMVMVCVAVFVQFWSEIVKVTVLTPEVLYVMPVGFSAVETAGAAPSPKFHEYDQLTPVLPVFVKLTAVLVHCGASDTNEAVGLK